MTWALLLVLGLFLVPPGVAFAGADNEDSSNHAIPFMRMGVGTRALGMGGAYVAAGSDATVGYWNPGALGWSCGTQVSAMYALGMSDDRNMSYLGASHHTGWGALGLSLLTAGMKDIEQRDTQGAFLGDFDYSDLAVMLHGAYAMDYVTFGATIKYLHQGLDADVAGDDGVDGYGFDFGIGIQPLEWVRFGVALRDVATEIGGDEDANVAPMNLRGGFALMPLQGFTFALDFDHVEDEDDLKFHAGTEYAFPMGEDFGGALRLGLNDGALTAGVGVAVRFVEFNYAFIEEPQDFMDESHRVGVTLRFGEDCEGFDYEPRMKDSDLDGIPDKMDACPHAAEDFDGFEDQDGCPDVDNDGDGIPDVDDDCPGRAEDFDGFQDMDGCPDIDNDGDGILDRDDKCPNAAETFNRFEDTDGCPDEAPIEFPMLNINFKFNSAEFMGTDPIPALERIAEVLRESPDVRVRIEGHTDSVGGEEYNTGLSLRRAEAVRDYLVEKGIGAERLMAEGLGEGHPVASNDSEQGRYRNRRIEFKVLD
ncbi:MAG: OmpA family protein [Candidatus Eisenbacteria sp.]|nr:OmpA family protein [Candidatus Eisenbacteria bacterium]